MRVLRIFAFLLVTAFALAFTPPVKAAYQGTSPNQMFACTSSAIYDASTSGATLLVTGTATQTIYVCGYVFWSNGTANVNLVYGTGATCGTGTTKITPAFQMGAQTGIVDHLPVYTGLAAVPSSNNLCINSSAAVAVQAIVYYTQFGI